MRRAEMNCFSPELFKFFRELKRHNDREWFQENKWRYLEFVRDPFLRFIQDSVPGCGRLVHISLPIRNHQGDRCCASTAICAFARTRRHIRRWLRRAFRIGRGKKFKRPDFIFIWLPSNVFWVWVSGIRILTHGPYCAMRSCMNRQNGRAQPAAAHSKQCANSRAIR